MINKLTYVMIIFASVMIFSCSSAKYSIKKTGKHHSQKTYNISYDKLWNTTYETILAKDDIEVALEGEGFIRTTWNYAQSKIHYVEYEFEGKQQTQPLRVRYRYLVTMQRVSSAVKLKIETEQEYEEVDPDDPTSRTGSWIATTGSAIKEENLLKRIDKALTK